MEMIDKILNKLNYYGNLLCIISGAFLIFGILKYAGVEVTCKNSSPNCDDYMVNLYIAIIVLMIGIVFKIVGKHREKMKWIGGCKNNVVSRVNDFGR